MKLRHPWIASPLLFAGCSETQSVLAPMGPESARISQLAGILFFGAVVVMFIVLAELWIAMRGSPAARRLLAADKAVLLGGVVFPVATLTILLAYGLSLMRAGIARPLTPDTLHIEVIGEQWWWRLTYLDSTGAQIAGANEVRIPVGRDVQFTLRSTDVIHSFWAPSLAGKVDMIPGRTNTLRLSADRPGIYRGQCAEYCGGPHALMAFEIVAVPEDAFMRWLAAAAALAPEPSDDEARRGRELFLAAGCGACHAVRGTAANGVIGPDLTRVGERRFIAAGTLPMSRANLAQFIIEGHRLKPGNGMPPFDIFSTDELNAVTAYLAALK